MLDLKGAEIYSRIPAKFSGLKSLKRAVVAARSCGRQTWGAWITKQMSRFLRPPVRSRDILATKESQEGRQLERAGGWELEIGCGVRIPNAVSKGLPRTWAVERESQTFVVLPAETRLPNSV